jgi:hypothetical protein
MPYVSCAFAPPDPLQAEPKPAGERAITCIDDHGRTWWLTEDSQVGDWLEYVKGGTVEPAAPNTNANITSAPDTLFGGPTIAEVLGEP